MGSALLKDILREIKKSLGRFLSILLIVALGVAFFAGVKASVPDMKYTADAYFDAYNMQDIHLISTVGFTEEDVEAIRGIEGVQGVHDLYDGCGDDQRLQTDHAQGHDDATAGSGSG